MANKAPYKTTLEPEHTIQPIYTGGTVALDQSGRILATTLGEDALLTDLNTGKQLAKIEGVCVDRHIFCNVVLLIHCLGWRANFNFDMSALPLPNCHDGG